MLLVNALIKVDVGGVLHEMFDLHHVKLALSCELEVL